MPSFERPPINEAFDYRKKYFAEVGKQFETPKTVDISFGDQKIAVDCRVISVEEEEKAEKQENPANAPIVLLPGFGSGWEGIAELSFSLAAEGRKVVLLSLPGYGNSENPPQDYYDGAQDFTNEADAVEQVIDKLKKNGDIDADRVHVAGHSMGSVIMATLAARAPEKISSLTLLNPASVNEEHVASVGAKFGIGGAFGAALQQMRLAFSGEGDYEEELHKYIPKAESPFTKERRAQRLSEVQRVSKEQILEPLKKLRCSVVYLSGDLDNIYPSQETHGNETVESPQLQKIAKAVEEAGVPLEKRILNFMPHNTTMLSEEVTANNIDYYLTKIELERQ